MTIPLGTSSPACVSRKPAPSPMRRRGHSIPNGRAPSPPPATGSPTEGGSRWTPLWMPIRCSTKCSTPQLRNGPAASPEYPTYARIGMSACPREAATSSPQRTPSLSTTRWNRCSLSCPALSTRLWPRGMPSATYSSWAAKPCGIPCPSASAMSLKVTGSRCAAPASGWRRSCPVGTRAPSARPLPGRDSAVPPASGNWPASICPPPAAERSYPAGTGFLPYKTPRASYWPMPALKRSPLSSDASPAISS